MRGSVYYQSSQLVKQIFEVGAKKEDKINPDHEHYQMVASYKTMESYRAIWNNFFNYLLEHWKLKDFEKIEPHHIQAYMDYKVEYYPSKQYLEKISAALGKLEIALKKFAKNIHNVDREYDFSIRQTILDEARDLKYVSNNYHNRAYNNPLFLIENLKDPLHKIAAKIQYEGGARIEGVALIKKDQMMGIKVDSITNKEVGIVLTKEKDNKEQNKQEDNQENQQKDESKRSENQKQEQSQKEQEKQKEEDARKQNIMSDYEEQKWLKELENQKTNSLLKKMESSNEDSISNPW